MEFRQLASLLLFLLALASTIFAAWRFTNSASNDNDDAVDEVKKPHVLFILADDVGYNDVGYRNDKMKTPTIDKV